MTPRSARRWPTCALACALFVAAAGVVQQGEPARAQGRAGGAAAPAQGRQGGPPQSVDNVEVRSMRVQGNVWMINAGFVNAAVQIGDEGVLVVAIFMIGLGLGF